MHTKKARNNWKLCVARTRTLPTRWKTFWTRLARVAATFTRSRRPGSAWRLRRMNFKPLWRKLKPLWNRKKTRCCAASLNSAKWDKKSTAASKRRRKNSRTPERTTNVLSTPCKHRSKQKPRLVTHYNYLFPFHFTKAGVRILLY